MQTMFAERTDWQVPWMERVWPYVLRIARPHAHTTIFTRFMPPARPENVEGGWRRYYERWPGMTLGQIDPDMIFRVRGAADP
jgi:hypothetical protein